MFNHRFLALAVSAALGSSLVPAVSHAQALEEIVVTAQRRVQSLQEVPISVEAISGAELQRQSYRDLNALSAFSPTVNVDQESIIGPTISIRGFGTSGNAVTLESATPIFVDGVHYSRMSMMKTAFLDVQQVEVLKGPQPVYFGQNATAGAFNIQSRQPTATWEGNLDVEFGTRNAQELSAGIGGPLSDTWRMRVAGTYEDAGGHLDNIISGDSLGAFENIGGRAILQWLPTSRLTATAKVDYGRIRKDVETVHICRTEGSLIFGRGGPSDPGNIGTERAIYADPPDGEGWSQSFAIPLDDDCFGSRNGVSAGGPYFQPPDYLREENMDYGIIDVREAAEGFARIDNRGINGYEDLDTWTSALRFNYEFDNGMTAEWNNAYVNYLRNYVRDNSYTGFLMNFQGREENYDQWSSEIRLSSPSGGMFEWNVSGFYQIGDLDIFSSSLRANVRRGQRYNEAWEDQEWFAGSGVFTFNFLDNRASIDLGARVAKLNKETYAIGYGANWVYDVRPCDPDLLPDKDNVTPADIGACIAGNADIPEGAVQVSADEVRILVDGPVDLDNLWTTTYDAGADRREVSPSWLPSQARAVGLGIPDHAARALVNGGDGGPFLGDFGRTEVDPQVTLRYRPTDDISLYARWAQSSKAGGYDTGQTSLPASEEDYAFAPEYAETWEVGAKGSYMDNRGRFDATLFTLEFTDLQISVATSDVDNPFINLNAGSQRVRGLEFGTAFAVSDQLTLGLGGAIMDGEFTNFPNSSCTQEESLNADTGPCLTAAEAIDLYGNDEAADTIDRTGTQTPRTPDWKLVGDLDYTMPVFDGYLFRLNAKAFYSDGYTTDFEGFSQVTRYDTHGDLNLLLGFGDINDTWSISLYGRNLLEPRPTHHPEFDIFPDGLLTYNISPNAFASYGVKLQYNFR